MVLEMASRFILVAQLGFASWQRTMAIYNVSAAVSIIDRRSEWHSLIVVVRFIWQLAWSPLLSYVVQDALRRLEDSCAIQFSWHCWRPRIASASVHGPSRDNGHPGCMCQDRLCNGCAARCRPSRYVLVSQIHRVASSPLT